MATTQGAMSVWSSSSCPRLVPTRNDVGHGRVDSGLGQCPVEQPAGGSDERLTLPVLDVSWLLTHEHQRRDSRQDRPAQASRTDVRTIPLDGLAGIRDSRIRRSWAGTS